MFCYHFDSFCYRQSGHFFLSQAFFVAVLMATFFVHISLTPLSLLLEYWLFVFFCKHRSEKKIQFKLDFDPTIDSAQNYAIRRVFLYFFCPTFEKINKIDVWLFFPDKFRLFNHFNGFFSYQPKSIAVLSTNLKSFFICACFSLRVQRLPIWSILTTNA